MEHGTITRGTGNVFADLGFLDAEERQTKLRLAYAINDVIARRRLTQAAAVERLAINQPKVSARCARPRSRWSPTACCCPRTPTA